MNSKFFTFIQPYLNYIDGGKLYKQPFRILYQVIAVLMLLFPFFFLYQLIDSGLMDGAPANIVVAAILIWIIIDVAGWLSFQLWWMRALQLNQTSREGDDFIATPVLSNLLQTLGEWLGSYMAIVGFLITLIGLIFMGEAMSIVNLIVPVMGGWGLIYFPVAGFIIIVIFRGIAEMIRALVAIANNTRK